MPLRAVLCDIEGTTSSISFVHKVLFPLSLERLDSFFKEYRKDAEVEREIESFRSRLQLADDSTVIAALRDFILKDVKDTTLKWLQGKIWKEAFEAGRIKGHIYPEVPEYFSRWKESALRICIYSSGSVEAQKLMFKYSEAGDISAYLDGYFDTTTGMKRDGASYERIARALQLPAHEILFLSDISEELAAAESAGMQNCLILRENAAIPMGYSGASARDFAEVHARFF